MKWKKSSKRGSQSCIEHNGTWGYFCVWNVFSVYKQESGTFLFVIYWFSTVQWRGFSLWQFVFSTVQKIWNGDKNSTIKRGQEVLECVSGDGCGFSRGHISIPSRMEASQCALWSRIGLQPGGALQHLLRFCLFWSACKSKHTVESWW